MSLRNHRVAAVSAGAALLVACSSFGAVAGSLITSQDIKNGEVKKADIGKGAVGSSEILDGTIRMRDLSDQVTSSMNGPTTAGAPGPAGAQGPKGDTGAQGPAGAPGRDGISGYEVRTWNYTKGADSDMGDGYTGVGGGGIATVACSPGKVATGGGYWFKGGEKGFESDAVHNGSGVVASFPGRMDWETNTVKPTDNSGWIVQVNDKVAAADMTLYVVCVSAR